MQVKAVEAAGTVLEVLSVSFGTLQKAPARPRASGSCREGFGGAIRQFRNPTRSCGWKAKGARSEQLMQVEAGGSCRDGFGGAIRQFRNPTKSCGWKAKGAGQESQERVEAAGRVLEVLSVSFETLQKAPARPRASGSCREGFGGAIRQFRNPTKSCGWKAKGARSEQLMQVCSESRWKLQGRFWRCRQFRNPTNSCGWKAKGARSEQLMQVKAGGSCRDGFGGAIRQFRNPTKSSG